VISPSRESAVNSSVGPRSARAPINTCETQTSVTSSSLLKPSKWVRDVETQDGAVLLDIQQGVCLGVNPVGATIWRMLKQECSTELIVERLCTDHRDVPRTLVACDVAEFIADLAAKRLLIPTQLMQRAGILNKLVAFMQKNPSATQVHCPTKRRRFLFGRAFLGLALFDLLRLAKDFGKSYALLRQWNVDQRIPTSDAVEQVSKAVNYACAWYPKRVLCLQRSIVTTCLLRQCGIPARIVFGAQPIPFKAHAWTEVDGRAINERRDVQRLYLIWERC
jgi:hypothetical protein